MTTISRNGTWLSATIDSELALMNTETGCYLVLSRVGGRIWEMLEVPMTLAEIEMQLLKEYEVNAEICSREVSAFIQALEADHAITRQPAGG